MKLASFSVDGRNSWGIAVDKDVFDVGHALSDRFPTLKSLIAANAFQAAIDAKARAERFRSGTFSWLPVIPDPDKIICIGINYEDHRVETGRTVVGEPTIFVRFANSQVGHTGPIVRPNVSSKLDFEGELAVVIGKSGRYVSAGDAYCHIAGYSCYNDGSVRDFQTHTSQFTPGKNFPSTGAFGPWMVTADELPELGELTLTTRLNQQIVQQAKFNQMIFSIPKIIEYCSTFTVLEPGDVIVTGTPGGVGARRNPPLWMKPGDTVEVEIEGIGTLVNSIDAE